MNELLLGTILVLMTAWVVEKLLEMCWWRPRRIQRHFREQGIRGPPYIPIIGSLGELARIYAEAGAAQSSARESGLTTFTNNIHLAFPHLPIWRQNYGKVYLCWYGRTPRLSISDPELIKEFTSTPRKYHQSIPHPLIHNLIHESILAEGGESWVAHRRLLKPFFHTESLRSLSGMVLNKVEERVNIWKSLMKSDELELDLFREFEGLMQEIIAEIVFGDDTELGFKLAKLQSEQAAMISKAARSFYIPGTKFIPTPLNRRSKWLRRELGKKLNGLIERRLQSPNLQKNGWLSSMLSSGNMARHQIIDDCCAILVAGSESTTILLAWACLHLGFERMWQQKARDEIDRVLLRENRPIIEILGHLKILTMIINETLRLYPSLPFVMKHSEEEVKLGGLKIPAGIDIEVPIMAVHYDAKTWGDNVGQFDPSRFSEGVSKASNHPMAFMPFMLGPRMCPGMNFSMIEAKVVLAVILQNFDITVSPRYKHSPYGGITLKQGNGAQVIIRKI